MGPTLKLKIKFMINCIKLLKTQRITFSSISFPKNLRNELKNHVFKQIISKKARQYPVAPLRASLTFSEKEDKLIPKKLILVIGATGTLGRQIVRKALEEGYDVRCIVRPREIPADFLREWGASVVNADLKDPASIPPSFVGVHTVIDAATARPEESIRKIDWAGKIALIQTAEAMKIQRYIFYSILECDKYPSIPLMNIKACTEDFIESTGLNFTIFRLCGFMQAIIGNYAIPILEERSVWGTGNDSRTAYLDTQDIANITLAALKTPETVCLKLTLTGPKAWTTREVISLCESLSTGSIAKITSVPMWVLKAVRVLLSRFDWSKDAADRLAFTNIAEPDTNAFESSKETYKLLGMDSSKTTTLEEYLEEYYKNMIKKLKEVGAESRQTDFYV